MRLLGLFPVLWIIVPVILNYLCIFAGSKKGFMEDSHILTLTADLTNALNGTAIYGLALPGESETVSIQSVFASTHLLTSCHGFYTNETATKHLRGCSARSLFSFDPLSALSTAVNESTHNMITIDDLHPYDMKYDLASQRSNFNAASVFYLFAVALTTIVLPNYIIAVSNPLVAMLIAACNPLLVYAAIMASLIASAIMTSSVCKAVEVVNQYHQYVGDSVIEASVGAKFMGMTWASLAVLCLAPAVMGMDFALLKLKGAKGRGAPGLFVALSLLRRGGAGFGRADWEEFDAVGS